MSNGEENSRAYDPVDYDTWPDEQKDFAGRVWNGLHNGNLQPLADYLRAGHYIEPALGREIAEAIEGVDAGFYHIVTKGRERGQRGWDASWAAHDKKMRVGMLAEKLVREYGPGGFDAAIAEVRRREKFAPKSSWPAEALSYARDFLKRADALPGTRAYEIYHNIYLNDSGP